MEGWPVTEIDDLARRIAELRAQLDTITLATRLTNSSVETPGNDAPSILADMVEQVTETAATIPGLQDSLDTLDDALAETRLAVAAAIVAATQAGADGIAAGEAASVAADDALTKAQQALDAAANAGGNSIYTGRPPTAADPGTPGQQWFVWDSNYKVTARYVFDGETSAWVEAELANQVIDNLDAGVITSGYISSARIAANTITAAQIAADTISSREVAADAILARNIKALQVTATHIAASTITGDKIAANTITAGNIKAGSITANEIAAGTITATQINLDSLNGKTITGATIKTAANGQRLEILNTLINIYNGDNGVAASILGSSYGTTQGAVTLRGSWSGVTGTLDVIGGAPETAVTGTAAVVGGGIGYASNVVSGKVSAFAQGFRAQQVVISPEFWTARVSGTPTRQELRTIGWVPTPNGYQRVQGAFGQVAYTYYDSSRQRQVDIPVILSTTDNSLPSKVMVQADEFVDRDNNSLIPAMGKTTYSGTIGANDSTTVTVPMPAGKFTSAPIAYANGSNSRITVGISSASATSVTFALGNWTNVAVSNFSFNWQAFAQ